MRFHIACVLFLVGSGAVTAQDHSHGSSAVSGIDAPKVFLDKSPRIVEYQLRRLDNTRLLMVERRADDEKYVPVYEAILSRPGVSPQHREEAIEALVKLKGSDPVTVLADALEAVHSNAGKHDDRTVRRTQRELASLLVRQPPDVLASRGTELRAAVASEDEFTASVGFAGLMTAGDTESVLDLAAETPAATIAWLQAIPLIRDQAARDGLRDAVFGVLDASETATLKNAAITALGFIKTAPGETFGKLASLVRDPKLRDAAVRTLLRVGPDERDRKVSADLLADLVTHAESTPPSDRTSNAFIDAMQLAESLMATVPANRARAFRDRLREITVRVVRIKTVEEEMRYDVPYFAVQAGGQVQVVLENHDLMPHNLVFTTPGALKEVAQLGLEVGPNNGWKGLQYVPESDKVLHATDMVAAHQEARLTFTAPTTPGEYPYVCTFPQHWYRMYGVMVVVEDLDAWLQNPIEPANPIGSNRTFVQAWTIDDFKGQMETGLVGRSPEIGKRIFVEASCAGCHKMEGEGGMIGPELSDVVARWKGDRMGVLREILEPSHKIDAKYAMQRVLTVDGRTLSGVLIKEDDDNITLMSNPEAKEPMIVAQDDIEAMVPSSVSMMPKALMDQYTKDEVFELMSYLEKMTATP